MGVLMIHHCGTTSKSLVVELVEVEIGTGCAINATRRSRVKGHLLAIPLCGVTTCNNLSAEIMKAIKEEHDDAVKRKHIRILEARKHADYLTLLDRSDFQNSRGKWTPRGEAYAVVAIKRNVLSLNLQRKYGGHEAHKKN
ncbi:hypothetical protein RJ639_043682 [Escallonia herrerae]|uniref:Uncharacterized protein n=1 Tax=Escallonia herrerae TaxID=1293975 RepID=A0AA88WB27_9ASTE|nr:hypothetical protein RJ639_043682 [Escallonia herrerae]